MAMIKLECRWCKAWLPNGPKAGQHEYDCILAACKRFDKETAKAAQEYRKHQLEWSIKMAQRWRGLPGKGWGALDKYPMVEYLGKVVKHG